MPKTPPYSKELKREAVQLLRRATGACRSWPRSWAWRRARCATERPSVTSTRASRRTRAAPSAMSCAGCGARSRCSPRSVRSEKRSPPSAPRRARPGEGLRVRAHSTLGQRSPVDYENSTLSPSGSIEAASRLPHSTHTGTDACGWRAWLNSHLRLRLLHEPARETRATRAPRTSSPNGGGTGGSGPA
jgi:hypothetical protein